MSSTAPAAAPLYTDKWWTLETVAVVTGANKGIGYDIARLLAENDMTVVLTARSAELGEEAANKIRSGAPGSRVVFHQLDVTDSKSIDDFATWLKSTYGGATILINNAGMAYKGNTFGADEAQTSMNTNLFGLINVTEHLLPLLKENARIINVTSQAGKSTIIPGEPLRNQFLNAKTKDEITNLANKFVGDIREGKHTQEGWPNSMYGMSKLCASMYSRILAEELKDKGIMVNALCPGYCATDMSSWKGYKTAAEGADTPVWLALRSPKEFTTGLFWTERKQIPY